MSTALEIHTVVSSPFEENTYVIWKKGQTSAVVIDPGLEPDLILSCLQQHELNLAAILNTHGHSDHIGGNEALKKAYPDAPLIIGKDEAFLLTDPRANLSGSFGIPIISPPADRTVVEGETLSYAGIDFQVIDLPGHSTGHVVFIISGSPPLVFGGDVLFRGSIGRTDFPGGSKVKLESGIRNKLYTLPPDTIVYPGHGPVTTIGTERKTNSFIKG